MSEPETVTVYLWDDEAMRTYQREQMRKSRARRALKAAS